MSGPRLLDLFCGAGGAACGYVRAGFDVTGVDHKPQKNYLKSGASAFIQADALEYCREHGHEFDAIHASPPCQAHTSLRSMWNSREHPELVGPTRSELLRLGLPFVMENVPGAPLLNASVLCGTMFDLGTGDAELRRHRLFETSFVLSGIPDCKHYARGRVCGVYGGHGRDRRRVSSVRDGTQQFSTDQRREAMGIDWMNGNELSQAIPPAYTEFIGLQLIEAVRRSVTA